MDNRGSNTTTKGSRKRLHFAAVKGEVSYKISKVYTTRRKKGTPSTKNEVQEDPPELELHHVDVDKT